MPIFNKIWAMFEMWLKLKQLVAILRENAHTPMQTEWLTHRRAGTVRINSLYVQAEPLHMATVGDGRQLDDCVQGHLNVRKFS